MDRIRVIARIRPLTSGELPATRVNPQKTSIQIATVAATKNYRLDCVLDQEETQECVFKHVEPMIEENVLQGINFSLFTYGQTGTGKTHTMLGYDLWSMAQEDQANLTTKYPTLSTDEETMGVIPRSMKYLFDRIISEEQEKGSTFRVFVSYIEVKSYPRLH